ncbi:ATP-grasp domain-containing protein [Streptomyces sp. Ru87]|uniref:ATP-grasp domain-containing protein n=1 Tax=Streptomyces sp. Ru87 TaxID=2044307 RepID=UPI000BF5B3C2|nr:ATP-grasp domain-containing protein [Streptomyces sp. Ru87]PGH49520.1 phosphoribosylglycinamide synthetase [Streptomyces sp. Ru87]
MNATPAGPSVVIVDGYSNSGAYTGEYAALGVGALHVQSTAEFLPKMVPPDLSAYRETFVCEGPDAVEDLVERLRPYAPIAVSAGQEPGVPLADLLSERLGVATNGTAGSRARRDKFTMIETVRAAGLHCAEQFVGSDPAGITAWARERGYPVVVKPRSSSSSDNVFVCRTEAEVTRAARSVLAGITMYDERNTDVLVQSHLDGTEYIVDTVSAHGRHAVCGVWRYDKNLLPSGRPLYDLDVLQDPDAPHVRELIAYVLRVLDALGIRHGPGHAEVIMTDSGPALVELGARLNGNMNPGHHEAFSGTNPARLAALAYARPAEFTARHGGTVYAKSCEAVVHNAATSREGLVTGIDTAVLDKIASLPTVREVVVRRPAGTRLVPTVDLMTSPLRVFHTARSQRDILADYRVVGQLTDDVFRLAGPAG